MRMRCKRRPLQLVSSISDSKVIMTKQMLLVFRLDVTGMTGQIFMFLEILNYLKATMALLC